MNVVLLGFMASGKTAVGRRIAGRLGYGFFDSDQFIENDVGCTIAELFENMGEAHFRILETRLIGHLHKLNNYVISTGGGILTTEGNLEALQKAGLTVFLNADRGEILQRLSRDTRRPKLKEGELEETVNRLLDERMASYCQCELVIDTKSKSVNRVAGEIIAAIAEAASSRAKAEATTSASEPLPAADNGEVQGAAPQAASAEATPAEDEAPQAAAAPAEEEDSGQ